MIRFSKSAAAGLLMVMTTWGIAVAQVPAPPDDTLRVSPNTTAELESEVDSVTNRHLIPEQTVDSLHIMSDPMGEHSKRSSFYIAAIKTVYGERPESEFFDIGVRIHLTGRFYSMSSFDVALTHSDTVADTTTPGSSSREFSDAGVTLDYELFSLNDVRQVFAGVKLKLFDGVPYWGFQLGVIELCNSALRGTFLTVGYLHTTYRIDSVQNALREKKEHRHNIFIEFGLMSHRADISIIKSMRIRAGILVPAPSWNENPKPVNSDVKTRIVIEVPIGELVYF